MHRGHFFVFLLVIACLFPSLASAQEKTDASKTIVRFNERIAIEKGQVVEGDVVAIGGPIDLAGTVKQNVVAIGGDVTLLPGGKVMGDATSVGGKVVKRGGEIVGTETSVGPKIHWTRTSKKEHWESQTGKKVVVEEQEEQGIFGGWGWNILHSIGMIALVTLLAALFPKSTDRLVFAAEQAPWGSLFWGIAVLVAIFPVAMLLIFSLIGIVLVPFELFLVCASALFGYAAMCVCVGRRLLAGFGEKAPWIAAPLLGAFLIQLVELVPVLGWFIKLAVVLFGLGAVVISRFGTRKASSIR